MRLALYTSKYYIVRNLIELMLYVNLFFALFPAWQLSPLWDIINHEQYFSVWMGWLSLINLGVCAIILMVDNQLYASKIFKAIIFLSITFFLSIIANGFQSGLLALFAIPIEYIILFIIIDRYNFPVKIINIVLSIFAIWIILPLFLFLIGPYNYKLAMMTSVSGNISTFGGFAFHRNFYGYYCGLTILIALISQKNKSLKLFICSFCAIGIILSASRSSLICTIIASLYILYKREKRIFIYLVPVVTLIIGSVFYISSYLDLRGKGLEDNDDRFELLRGFKTLILQNPFFGKGDTTLYYSPNYPVGSPAHNFIAQVWADYGIINLISFIILLLICYKNGNYLFRVFFIYLILFGLSQPYFYLSMPQSFMVITLLMGSILSKYNYEKNRNFKPRSINS